MDSSNQPHPESHPPFRSPPPPKNPKRSRSRSRSRSPPPPKNPKRSRSPSPRRDLLVSRPRDYMEYFSPEFLGKHITDVVVVVCHSETCGDFQKKSRHPKPMFRTAYDAIFTADLGTTTTTDGTSYDICTSLLERPVPNKWTHLVSRLKTMARGNGILMGSKTNLKTIGTHVTDLDIFGPGIIVGKGIDDGIFWFKVGDHPPTTEAEVRQRNIAGHLFSYTSPHLVQTPDGGLTSSWNPYETSAGESIKLSDLLKRDGALARFTHNGHRLDPSSTAVIVVTCRVIKGVRKEDWFPFQSPSPSSAESSAVPSLSPQTWDWVPFQSPSPSSSAMPSLSPTTWDLLLQTQSPTTATSVTSSPSPRGGTKRKSNKNKKSKKNKKSNKNKKSKKNKK